MLRNGMKIGISLDHFSTLTGTQSSLSEQNVRYEYTHDANEHAYIFSLISSAEN